MNALETGQTDASRYAPCWSLQELQGDRRMSVTRVENRFRAHFVGMKIDRELVSDVHARPALSLAVDRKAIGQALTFGHADPASPCTRPSALGFDKGVKPETLGESAGAVQGDLRKVGIDAQIQLLDATVARGRLVAQERDAFGMSAPCASPGDAPSLYFRSANVPVPSRMNCKDADTGQWLAAGPAALDAEDRQTDHAKARSEVHDAALRIPLHHEPLHPVTGSRLGPVRAHGIHGAGRRKGLDLALE